MTKRPHKNSPECPFCLSRHADVANANMGIATPPTASKNIVKNDSYYRFILLP
jgi:hypothetical protein